VNLEIQVSWASKPETQKSEENNHKKKTHSQKPYTLKKNNTPQK